MKNNSSSSNKIVGMCKIAVVCALYVVLTVFFESISFSWIQLRISEILLFMVFFDRKYSYGILLGTIISNFLSPLGLVDVLFGTFATTLVLALMIFIPNPKKILSLLWAPAINSVVVGFEWTLINSSFVRSLDIFNKLKGVQVTNTTFSSYAIPIFCGEFIVIFLGYLIYLTLQSNKTIVKFLTISEG